MRLWRLKGDRRISKKCITRIQKQDKERERTGGSNTFTLPPSAASIFMYVSSSANYRQAHRQTVCVCVERGVKKRMSETARECQSQSQSQSGDRDGTHAH